ncbi:MAG TPA: hypothetical protein VLI06_11440 [Solimonas sp.]|nr:hypothetical protein [Solimonas sp.]
MNSIDTYASIVLSGAGESLYEMDVQQTAPEQSCKDKASDAPVARKASDSRPTRHAMTGLGLCAMSAAANGAGPAIPASGAYVAVGGAVPAGLSVLLWAPLIALTLGCAVWLLVLIVRQPRQPRQQATPVYDRKAVDSPGTAQSPYELQKAA